MRLTRAAAIGLAAVAIAVAAAGAWVALAPNPARDLPAWDELDTRWGTYLSERQWGTPREAVGADPWGLDYLEAVRTTYRYGEDGIAGLTTRDGTFNLGWALWDGEQVRVAERLFGWGNRNGEHGEAIVDRRVFNENTPTSSYARQTLRYPNSGERFEVALEEARADDVSGVLRATATNTGDDAAPLHLVAKGWFAEASLRAELVEDGLLLHGPESVLALLSPGATASQVNADKGTLDANLRAGGLVGGGPGHIGALDHLVQLDAGASGQVRLAWAEAPSGTAALERARELLGAVDDVLERRAGEADSLLAGDVTEHEPLYRQALMSLLWSQSLYTWDGASEWRPEWSGRVDADNVLIMPDKWEFPWLATWDTAFHAVTAARIDPQLGADQLRFILGDGWQQPDGHVPCAEFVMEVECPPIFAWAAWRVAEAGAGDAFLAEVYPALERLYDYWWATQAVEPAGLFTCGFCGMDNLPRGDGTAQVDATGWMAFFADHLARIADRLGETDAAAAFGADRDRIAAALNEHLWADERGFYFDRDTDGTFILTRSYTGLVPLIAGLAPPEREAQLIDALRDERAFLSPHGIRSVAADSVLYAPGYAEQRGVNSNWRGPIWLPLNYLLVQALDEADPALAATIRERVVATVEADWRATGRLHEYFDAETGEGLGADAQAGWTALVADLIAEGWPAGEGP